MTTLVVLLVGVPAGFLLYTYGLYPAVLKVWGTFQRFGYPWVDPDSWPSVSFSLPVHDEEEDIADTLDHILALEYPSEKLQVLVISDASNDSTDEIVRRYEARGVELLRLDERGGKTAAENAALPFLDGEIIVNTDATTKLLPSSLKPLIRAFQDPTIGVASGRDVSEGVAQSDANVGEAGYVGYEMWVRSLETRVGSIVGASGCFYAIRRRLHLEPVPENLSRDFLSALRAREAMLRAVSVNEAVCIVPRTGSMRAELTRKERTMARGLDTLWAKRSLMNLRRHGRFAFMLISHKLCRWLVPLSLPIAVAGLIIWSLVVPPVAAVLLSGLLFVALLLSAWARLAADEDGASLRGFLAYTAMANVAALRAWGRFLRRERSSTWEPTRRRV